MPSLTPRHPDFIDLASTRVITRVEVRATPEEVWEVLTDNERWPEWLPAAKTCRTTSDVAEGVGATRWMHRDLFKVNERFVAWDPPRRWVFTIVDANMPGFVSVVQQAVIERVDDETSVLTYTLAADVAPYMRPAVPFLRWRLGGLFKKGLAGIEGQVAKLRDDVA